jgi:hypothetical protein
MDRTSGFLRQHVIALLALTLVVGGGAAVAAGTTLPKNSVASKQVKNNSLKGKDLKDRSVTGTDLRDGTVTGADLGDGSVTGSDLGDGTVQKTDLAKDAADEVRVFYYGGGGGTVTVWEEPGLAKATFSHTCASNFSLNTFVSLARSPGRAGVYGFEERNHSSEAEGTGPLLGAATISRLNDVGQPVGGASFSGAKFGFGHVTMFVQTPRLDVIIDLEIILCSARGTISIDHKPEGSVITRPAAGQRQSSCEATGAAYCREPA